MERSPGKSLVDQLKSLYASKDSSSLSFQTTDNGTVPVMIDKATGRQIAAAINGVDPFQEQDPLAPEEMSDNKLNARRAGNARKKIAQERKREDKNRLRRSRSKKERKGGIAYINKQLSNNPYDSDSVIDAAD
jgi:hypothetical protein